MFNCPVCFKEEAIHDPTLGILPGKKCQKRRENQSSPSRHYSEFTSREIKQGRKEYAKSVLQPRMGTTPSKEFIEAYPEEAKITFTEKEIKDAKYVYKGIKDFKNWKESK